MKRRFYLNRDHGFAVVFGRFVFLPKFKRVRKTLAWVRGLFPICIAAAYYCCDSRRYYAWSMHVTWNRWTEEKLCRELDKCSDGTRIYRISYLKFIKQALKGETRGEC